MSDVIGKIVGDVVWIGEIKGVTRKANRMCANVDVENAVRIIEGM
jgi:hypothetical protein